MFGEKTCLCGTFSPPPPSPPPFWVLDIKRRTLGISRVTICLSNLQPLLQKSPANMGSFLSKENDNFWSLPVVTEWQRLIGCLIFIGHFLQKNPMISGSFAENDLQLEVSYGSDPPCTTPVSPCNFTRHCDTLQHSATHYIFDLVSPWPNLSSPFASSLSSSLSSSLLLLSPPFLYTSLLLSPPFAANLHDPHNYMPTAWHTWGISHTTWMLLIYKSRMLLPVPEKMRDTYIYIYVYMYT